MNDGVRILDLWGLGWTRPPLGEIATIQDGSVVDGDDWRGRGQFSPALMRNEVERLGIDIAAVYTSEFVSKPTKRQTAERPKRVRR